MKVKIIRNPSRELLAGLEVTDAVAAKIVEGREPVDLDNKVAEKLIEENVAERWTEKSDVVRGVAKAPEIALPKHEPKPDFGDAKDVRGGK